MKRGWKIILGLVVILTILTVLILYFRPANKILVYSVPLCNTPVEKTIQALVKKDFPLSRYRSFYPKVAEVMAVNNTQCVDEKMASVGIIVSDGSIVMFGIHRIHFSTQGTLIASERILSWLTFQNKNDPQIDSLWKNFIKTESLFRN